MFPRNLAEAKQALTGVAAARSSMAPAQGDRATPIRDAVQTIPIRVAPAVTSAAGRTSEAAPLRAGAITVPGLPVLSGHGPRG